MSTSHPLATTELVRANSKREVSVGGDSLTISKVHMWRDDQPRVTSAAEEAERSTSPQIHRPLNLTLTVRRTDSSNAAASADLDSSVLPYAVALHVLREEHLSVKSVAAVVVDDPTAIHFRWPAPPATTATAAASAPAELAYGGAHFLARAMDGGGALSLSAWNGPTWSTLRNGIDDTIDFVAVVEFQGGIYLASEKQRVEVVH